jgi:hypothetical protein
MAVRMLDFERPAIGRARAPVMGATPLPMIRSISMPLSVRCLSKPAARRSSNQQLRPSVQNQPWVRLADASETILVFVIAFGQIAPPQPGQRITRPLNRPLAHQHASTDVAGAEAMHPGAVIEWLFAKAYFE